MRDIPDHPESLQPVLRECETELNDTLEEVCEQDDVSKESTAELIKLEEALSTAADIAKETVSLRRRIREKGDVHGNGPAAHDSGSEASP